jgi:hypothetical protein
VTKRQKGSSSRGTKELIPRMLEGLDLERVTFLTRSPILAYWIVWGGGAGETNLGSARRLGFSLDRQDLYLV